MDAKKPLIKSEDDVPSGRIGRPEWSSSSGQGVIGISRNFCCPCPLCFQSFEMKSDLDAEPLAEAPEQHLFFVLPCFTAPFKAVDANVEADTYVFNCVDVCQANVVIKDANEHDIGNVKCEMNPCQYCIWCDGERKKVFGAYDADGNEKFNVKLKKFWCCEPQLICLKKVFDNLPKCTWWKNAQWDIESANNDAVVTSAMYRGHVWCDGPLPFLCPQENLADVDLQSGMSAEDRSLVKGIAFMMSVVAPMVPEKI